MFLLKLKDDKIKKDEDERLKRIHELTKFAVEIDDNIPFYPTPIADTKKVRKIVVPSITGFKTKKLETVVEEGSEISIETTRPYLSTAQQMQMELQNRLKQKIIDREELNKKNSYS